MYLHTSTRLALTAVGAGLALSGAILALRAAWGAVALAWGPLWASAALGAALALGGVSMVALARRSKRPPPPPSPQAAMLGAFFEGLRAGRATGARRS